MNRKAQAAMEFLMTYGWAILVVLAAIGALAYFGVLSPDKILPERCTGPAGLDCLEKASMATTSTSFVLKNNLGFDISTTAIGNGADTTARDCEPNSTTISIEGGTATAIGNQTINNGQKFVVSVTCTTPMSSGRNSQDYVLSYTTENSLTQTGLISIRGKI